MKLIDNKVKLIGNKVKVIDNKMKLIDNKITRIFLFLARTSLPSPHFPPPTNKKPQQRERNPLHHISNSQPFSDWSQVENFL